MPAASQVLNHPWVKAHCCAATDARPAWFDHWYCDLGGEGCLRPTELTHSVEQQRCWAFKDEYMVCEVCYQSGQAEHQDELVLYEPVSAEPSEAQGDVRGAAEGGGGDGNGGASRAGPSPSAEEQPLNEKVAIHRPTPSIIYSPPFPQASASTPTRATRLTRGSLLISSSYPQERALNEELQQLKAKHGAGSRLEALMLELVESRGQVRAAEEELADVKAQLEASQQLVAEFRRSA